MVISEELFKLIEDALTKEGFSVCHSDYEGRKKGTMVTEVTISKYTTYGQDFSFDITIKENDSLDDICNTLFEKYENFDVSEESMLWLDEFGHGKNGAPYEMCDVYKDMEEAEGFINQCYLIVVDLCENEDTD